MYGNVFKKLLPLEALSIVGEDNLIELIKEFLIIRGEVVCFWFG